MNITPRKRPNSAHQRGVTLIEALIALAVMVTGTAAVFGIHSYVTGNSAQSRAQAAVQSLAQEKIEELRQTLFSDIESGSDTPTISLPMLGGSGSRTVTVNRCWSVAEEGMTNLLRITVDAALNTPDCTANNPNALVTFIAEQDPRIAAQNLERRRRSDGDVIIDSTPPAEFASKDTSGGFDLFKDAEGKLLAVGTPGGRYIKPKSGDSLKIAELAGNILFSSAHESANLSSLRNELKMEIDRRDGYGQEFCNIFAEGSGIPFHLQYLCILPDQWMGAVTLTPHTNDAVCLGHPELDTSNSIPDPLLSSKRYYYGQDADGKAGGIQGRDDGSAKIGSICSNANTNCRETSLKNWVPGGHHFYIKKKSETKLCGQIMQEQGETLAILDGVNSVLYRNPSWVHCINDKDFTDSLPLPDFSSDQVFTSQSCYSFTRIGGFINTNGTAASARSISLTTTPSATCVRFSTAADSKNGGYFCDFTDSELGDRVINLNTPDLKFINGSMATPARLTINPSTKPYDFTEEDIGKN